jgi:formamidopyrimidine-DNA glycosylase
LPELPEVETVRRGLAPVLEGRRLARVTCHRPDLRFALPERMAERLTGTRVVAMERRAKYLLARLDSGETWLTHLGMSGRFRIEDTAQGAFHHAVTDNPAHDHVVLRTEAGAEVTFNDPRRFGYMDLFPTAEADTHRHLAGLGPEPLSNAFHAGVLVAAFAGRRTPVKAALLNQATVAGLGNIYVCEAMFTARIHPTRLAHAVTAPESEALTVAIRATLEAAIEAGGSTLRDFAHTDGSLGYFQHTFRVYDREGEPCTACGTTLERIVQSGRSSFFCPSCQR